MKDRCSSLSGFLCRLPPSNCRDASPDSSHGLVELEPQKTRNEGYDGFVAVEKVVVADDQEPRGRAALYELPRFSQGHVPGLDCCLGPEIVFPVVVGVLCP